MAPPSPISIATNSITRLLKEESSYRTELASQQEGVGKLQEGGGGEGKEEGEGEEGSEGSEGNENREFRLRQEKQAVEETKAVFGPLRERIAGAVEKLERLLESSKVLQKGEVDAANDALVRAKATTS